MTHAYLMAFLHQRSIFTFIFFFFNDTATTEIYTLSLHDALPIYLGVAFQILNDLCDWQGDRHNKLAAAGQVAAGRQRSEEHTSELQSRFDLVCRLLLEKKKKNTNDN